MIPYGRQTISEADILAVVEAMRSDFLTQGPVVPRFEHAIAERCGVKHAVAVNSATSALHIACLALGVGPGDRVWTSPNTFVASANCALYCGATVDFVDIDPATYNMSPQALAAKLENAAASGRLPKVVIPVHFSGQPCDLAALAALARRYEFRLLEDASHAIGARYGDSIIGDCRYSDITVFSLHPVKLITAGEGGIATTNSLEIAERISALRSHGIVREASQLERSGEGAWYYEQQQLGFNYRMTELHGALGLSQLGNLTRWIDRRHELADVYDRCLAALPLILPRREEGSRSALHLYVVQLDSDRCRLTRRSLYEDLRADGIGVAVHYIPVHTQPYYRRLGFQPGDFPVSEGYYERCLTLPLFPALTAADQERVCSALQRSLA